MEGWRCSSRPAGDGTTHILMDRGELIERLVPLIPPPRAHQVRYHGILAPTASLRDRIVPGQPEWSGDGEPAESGGEKGPEPKRGSEAGPLTPLPAHERREPSQRLDALAAPGKPERECGVGSCAIAPRESAGRMRWAALLQRVFEIDALRCPQCGWTMRLIAAIEDPDVARRILECLKLPARAPPLGDATAGSGEPVWPEDDWCFDQSPDCEEV